MSFAGGEEQSSKKMRLTVPTGGPPRKVEAASMHPLNAAKAWAVAALHSSYPPPARFLRA